eukprot:gene15617-biopygen1586
MFHEDAFFMIRNLAKVSDPNDWERSFNGSREAESGRFRGVGQIPQHMLLYAAQQEPFDGREAAARLPQAPLEGCRGAAGRLLRGR